MIEHVRIGDLEVLAGRAAAGRKKHPYPLVFVHGAFMGAWCWEPFFLPYFAGKGWDCYALSLSGHGGSRERYLLDSYDMDDYVHDVEELVTMLDTPVVLIGHSMGGMVVQKYLEDNDALAAVLLCSVPPQGLMGSALDMIMTKPFLFTQMNTAMNSGHVSTMMLRNGLFYQEVDEDRLHEYCAHCQSESLRAIWDMTMFNLPDVQHLHLPPLLVAGAGEDRIISPSLVESTAVSYDVEARIIPHMGHGVMLERNWNDMADCISQWLIQQKLEKKWKSALSETYHHNMDSEQFEGLNV